MAPKINLTFAGSSIYDVDPGQQTWGRVFADAQGDVAGTLALLTDDTLADHIDHSGAPRGARLGVPLVNQPLNRNLRMDGGTADNGGVATGDVFAFPFIFKVPPGETALAFEASFDPWLARFPSLFRPRLRVAEASDYAAPAASSFVVDLRDTPAPGAAAGVLSQVVAGLTPGSLVVFWLLLDGFSDGGQRMGDTGEGLGTVTIRPARSSVPTLDLPRDEANPVHVPDPGDPSTGPPLAAIDIDEAMFADFMPVSGWHTTTVDANVASVAEFLTGGPAGSNRDYTHAESATTDPAVSRFHAGTRKGFADEPLLFFPVVSVHAGGIKENNGGYLVDPASSASYNNRRAFAPYPLTKASSQVLRCRAGMPDFPTAANLRWAVLLGGNAGKTAWSDIRVRVQSGTSTISGAVTPTAISNHPTSDGIALAQGSSIAFARDVAVGPDLRVFVEDVGAAAYDPLRACVLAACFWFEE